MAKSHKWDTAMSWMPHRYQEEDISWLLNDILGDVPLRVIGKAIDVSGTSVERYKKGTRKPAGMVLERLLQGIDWTQNKIEEYKLHELTGEGAIRTKQQIQIELLEFFQNIGPHVEHIRNWSERVQKITDGHKQRITEQYAHQMSKRIDDEETRKEILNTIKLAIDHITVVLFDNFCTSLTKILSLRHQGYYSQKRSEEILEQFAKAYGQAAQLFMSTWAIDMSEKQEKAEEDKSPKKLSDMTQI